MGREDFHAKAILISSADGRPEGCALPAVLGHSPAGLRFLLYPLLSYGKKGRNPRQKCITCIAGGASRLGTAHGESSFLMKSSGGLSAGGKRRENSIRSRAGLSIHRARRRREARSLAPCTPSPPGGLGRSPSSPAPTKTGQDRAMRKAEQGLRRSIPKVPKSTDKASICEKGADAWGNPARQCPIKEKRHGKRG